jgi:DNA-directed RNA polymerase subunit M/transcription elongation factor TFIIS
MNNAPVHFIPATVTSGLYEGLTGYVVSTDADADDVLIHIDRDTHAARLLYGSAIPDGVWVAKNEISSDDPHQYHIEAVAMFGCPICHSEDLAFYGETEQRTETNVTDHIDCEDCDWTWTRPNISEIA